MPASHSSSSAVLRTGNLGRCKEPLCESHGVVIGFCRLHYIKNWARIKAKQQILADGQLVVFIYELAQKFSDKIIEQLHVDLSSASHFERVIEDLGLDEDEADEILTTTTDEDAPEDSDEPVVDTFAPTRRSSDEPEDLYM